MRQSCKRCRLIAYIATLVYNWWSFFVRLADPTKQPESITSRPLLLQAAESSQYAGQ